LNSNDALWQGLLVNDGDLCARHYATGQPVRVTWQNGRIRAVLNANQPTSPDLWIAPALVDLQVNGFGGIDFQQDNAPLGDLVTASRRLRSAGCTRYLLTLITDEWPRLIARLRHLRELRQRRRICAMPSRAGTSKGRSCRRSQASVARTIRR
jgi:N-acetylglucosamine-6-phosphate deacetylase